MIWSRRERMESGRRKSRDTVARRSKPAKLEETEITIPIGFRCPISLELMKDPVTLCTGITYDRQSIETWIDAGNATCPVSNVPLDNHDLIPNHALRRMIQNWCVENRAAGIERIPTPRIPTTRAQVTEILSEIESASHHGGLRSITSGAKTIRHLTTESERNRRCVVGSGTSTKLAAAFAVICERFAYSDSWEPDLAAAVESVLAAMMAVAPLDAKARSHLRKRSCMSCLAGVLQEGSLEGRGNAASLLREAMRNDEGKLEDEDKSLTTVLESTPGLVEGLVRVVREPICPGTTKASLTAILRMTSESDRIGSRVVDLGLVPVLLEILPDCDRSACEKALALLDQATSSKDGREWALRHALSVPAVVKKMLRISDAATNLAVSILWRLCCPGSSRDHENAAAVEALSAGLFQKLLLLLQMGCGDTTKTKATDLLRMMAPFKDRFECVDSWDFKNLKRPA